MIFKLNELHRNVPNEELLNDLIRVSQIYGSEKLTIEMYSKYGKYATSTFSRRFGSWKNALHKIGLKFIHGSQKNKDNVEVTNEELISDLKHTAEMLGVDTLTTSEYEKHGKHGRQIFKKRFKNWEDALNQADLKPTGYCYSVSEKELLEDIEETWIKIGRQPTTTDIKNRTSKYSLNSFTRKFGSWRKALEAFIDYVNNDNDDKDEIESADTTQQTEIIDNSDQNKSCEIKRKTKRDINLRLRFLVMKRDNFKCCICGRSPATTTGLELHVDHIIPWAKGGETVIDNLQTLCKDCNLGKSDIYDE